MIKIQIKINERQCFSPSQPYPGPVPALSRGCCGCAVAVMAFGAVKEVHAFARHSGAPAVGLTSARM